MRECGIDGNRRVEDGDGGGLAHKHGCELSKQTKERRRYEGGSFCWNVFQTSGTAESSTACSCASCEETIAELSAGETTVMSLPRADGRAVSAFAATTPGSEMRAAATDGGTGISERDDGSGTRRRTIAGAC